MSKESIEFEARRIVVAGQSTAIRATGGEVVKAGVGESGRAILEVREDRLFAGFNDHVRDPCHSRAALEDHVRAASPELARMMLFAQTRAILAGDAALQYADITGALGHTTSEPWRENGSRGELLLQAFADILDIDYETGISLFQLISDEADTLVGSNWKTVCGVRRWLKETGQILAPLPTLTTLAICKQFPIDPKVANTVFESAERSGLALALHLAAKHYR